MFRPPRSIEHEIRSDRARADAMHNALETDKTIMGRNKTSGRMRKKMLNMGDGRVAERNARRPR